MSNTFYYLFVLYGRGNWRIPKKDLTEENLRGWADNWLKTEMPQAEIDEAVNAMLALGAIEDCGTCYRISDEIRELRRETREKNRKNSWWERITGSWDEDRWDFVDKLKERFEPFNG